MVIQKNRFFSPVFKVVKHALFQITRVLLSLTTERFFKWEKKVLPGQENEGQSMRLNMMLYV